MYFFLLLLSETLSKKVHTRWSVKHNVSMNSKIEKELKRKCVCLGRPGGLLQPFPAI